MNTREVARYVQNALDYYEASLNPDYEGGDLPAAEEIQNLVERQWLPLARDVASLLIQTKMVWDTNGMNELINAALPENTIVPNTNYSAETWNNFRAVFLTVFGALSVPMYNPADPILDADGDPVLDADGNPTFNLFGDGRTGMDILNMRHPRES